MTSMRREESAHFHMTFESALQYTTVSPPCIFLTLIVYCPFFVSFAWIAGRLFSFPFYVAHSLLTFPCFISLLIPTVQTVSIIRSHYSLFEFRSQFLFLL
jgi:hypothetical protein